MFRSGSVAVAVSAMAAVFASGPSVAAAPPAARPVAALDEAFAASARDLVARARATGFRQLADLVAGWQVPVVNDRQFAFAIPPRLEMPDWITEPAARAIWDDFVAARRGRAAGLFDLAVAAAGEHDRLPTRDERPHSDPDSKPPNTDTPPLAQRSCAVVQLLAATLRDDPDHDRARGAVGWVRRGDAWIWPEAAARLDRRAEYDPAFGWLPAGRLARYRAGERFVGGQWMTAAEDAARTPPVERGRRFETDHWDILSAAPLESAATLAARLEETFLVWVQIFGAFGVAPADLEMRLRARTRILPRDGFAAVLCIDREQYVAELGRIEPLAPRTDGLYWAPTRTAWFFATPPGDVAGIIHHEATHQLFLETLPTAPRRPPPQAGERSGFWAIEAAACHMESIRRTPFGWTVGGRDAGRVPAARNRLIEDGVHVPLAELAAMGRRAFQADARLVHLYDEVAGLADFFMNGHNGRYREAFVEYLSRVYAGSDQPDTLPRLCRRTAAELDAEYRRHLE